MRKLLKARLGGDDGIALVLVIGVGTVLAILVVAAISFAIGGQRTSRTSQNWDGALSAAYAGIEEYQSRMAADPAYWRFGNPAASFSSTSASTVSLPPIANAAFGVGATGAWAAVAVDPSATVSTTPAQFRYEVDNSDYISSGVLRIRATGRVGQSTRTLVADLKQEGFLDFLYFTDYEIRDPSVSSTSCTPAYAWVSANRPNCTEIQFGSGDKLSGPVHSNDTLLVCGASLTGNVTTANPNSPYYKVVSGCGSPTLSTKAAEKPHYSPVVGMPSTNSELKKETRSDLPADVPNAGCLYTGPTSIEFLANGKMTVKSPWTKLTNISGDPATSGSVSAKCGTPGTGGLGSSSGQTIDVPKNAVIYVQNIPSTSGAPNYTGGDATGTGANCLTTGGSAASTNNVGFPASGELVPSTSSSNPSYGCRNGDLFVKGTVSAQATLAAENFVYVTGDIKYNDAQKDMLGLVGQNAVYVWSPIKCTDTDRNGNCTEAANLYAASDRRIDSAILSVAHFFQVQNYNYGTYRGILTINGAIAQKFRGTVATTSGSNFATGYAKNYLYDTRFRYTAPPKFLSPVTTTYGVTVWVETNRAFDAKGNQL